MIKNSEMIPNEYMLRVSWHEKIEKMLHDAGKKTKDFPYRFAIIEKQDKFYVSQDKKGKYTIKISETALQYLCGIEVPDANIGMYLHDYLPNENSLVIINSKTIIPAKFVLAVSESDDAIIVDLVFENVIKGGIIPTKNEKWKFIIYGDVLRQLHDEEPLDKKATSIQEYMDDVEKMIQDTIIHKTIVSWTMNNFTNFMEREGSLTAEEADALRERAFVHDNSKLLNKPEFEALTGIINDKSCLRNADSALSTYKQDAIELHWKNNSHHPEHYETPDMMDKLDRYEFVCDCYSRSLQYGTDLIDFMEKRQKQRFHFPELMYDEILRYCKILRNL